jgi:transcriptional regulator with XRE-family HTH domain
MVPTVVETPTTFWGYIGHVVKTKREELNLTDREVVERITAMLTSQQEEDKKSFSINTYRSIERGEETNSKINTYIYIAEALDLHISELIPPKN